MIEDRKQRDEGVGPRIIVGRLMVEGGWQKIGIIRFIQDYDLSAFYRQPLTCYHQFPTTWRQKMGEILC